MSDENVEPVASNVDPENAVENQPVPVSDVTEEDVTREGDGDVSPAPDGTPESAPGREDGEELLHPGLPFNPDNPVKRAVIVPTAERQK